MPVGVLATPPQLKLGVRRQMTGALGDSDLQIPWRDVQR